MLVPAASGTNSNCRPHSLHQPFNIGSSESLRSGGGACAAICSSGFSGAEIDCAMIGGTGCGGNAVCAIGSTGAFSIERAGGSSGVAMLDGGGVETRLSSECSSRESRIISCSRRAWRSLSRANSERSCSFILLR